MPSTPESMPLVGRRYYDEGEKPGRMTLSNVDPSVNNKNGMQQTESPSAQFDEAGAHRANHEEPLTLSEG